MVIGNPCDDWNFKEELHDYMDVPPNHPGALADVGFEHDSYVADIVVAEGAGVCAVLRTDETNSRAFGLVKELRLSTYQDHTLQVEYSLPETLRTLDVEFGLSPDYLNLLRKGRSILKAHQKKDARGWSTDSVAVWVTPADSGASRWTQPYQVDFGHGCTLRLSVEETHFALAIGVETTLPAAVIETASSVYAEESA